MNVERCLDKLVPAAKYGGVAFPNTEEAYNSIRWEDERSKPTWQDILDIWPSVEADLISLDYQKQLGETDNDFIRVLDDLITVLTSTGVIVLDDLPTEAKTKYNNRKSLRENI